MLFGFFWIGFTFKAIMAKKATFCGKYTFAGLTKEPIFRGEPVVDLMNQKGHLVGKGHITKATMYDFWNNPVWKQCGT